MILYIPTSEAQELLELLSKVPKKTFNESWLNDMMWQIREQLPKSTKTINLSDRIKELVEMTLAEKGIK